ncbi:TorF family putative porin [Herbaspirillum sp. SJZ107]|uniref:TorF family putative porin n=1 Tax=Herbaspirillum sp. SJZ107 TaxID=2572881 RepID=UPI0011501F7B|nr:TorF family putative porin [Herbaspirillum sp. SJZ107]TQK02907.1 uncharacterized protein (TIGR02001 family) [Herbaspirillum sp. SJZ107]
MKRLSSKWFKASFLGASLWTLTIGVAGAQEQPPEHQVSYNAAVTSDYRYRGLSQSRLDPALQGGADYVHNPTGLYVGTWLSTIKWTKDLGGDGNIEWDIYGGKRGNLSDDITYDVGGLYYFYPNNSLTPNANTFELYGQLGYGPAYIKYSHSLTNLFGTANSKQSGYVDIGANVDLGSGFTLNLHAGHQEVRHNGLYSYSDYKVGVTKDFGIASVALAYIKANTDGYLSPSGENLGKSAALLTVSKTF